MRQASKRVPDSAEKKQVRDIRRATRRHHSAEEKIRTRAGRPARRGQHCRVWCRKEGINPKPTLLYRLVKGVPGGGQEKARRRHGAGGDLGRGQGAQGCASTTSAIKSKSSCRSNDADHVDFRSGNGNMIATLKSQIATGALATRPGPCEQYRLS